MALQTVRKEFLIERQGETYARFAGLLDAAHRSGLISLTTTLIQSPTSENGATVIFSAKAILEIKEGQEVIRKEYTGHGDASPKNVNASLAGHFIRIAETRAEARALRNAINFKGVALEETEHYTETDARQEETTETRHSTDAHITPQRPTSRRVEVAETVPAKPSAADPLKVSLEAFRQAAYKNGISPAVLGDPKSLRQIIVLIAPDLARVAFNAFSVDSWEMARQGLVEYVQDKHNPPLPGTPAYQKQQRQMAGVSKG